MTTTGSVYPVVLDLDFADGLVRPDTTLWLFDGGTVANPVTPTLIYTGTNSNIVDDQAGLGNGSTDSILTSGSYGANDPYIGPIYLMEGHVYYVAVTTAGATADGGNPRSIPACSGRRWSSITAVAKDYVGSQGSAPYTLFPGTTNQQLNLAATPYELNDVSFYVLTDTGLDMVDPFTGTVEAASGALPATTATAVTYGDLVMRNDGELYTISRGATTPARTRTPPPASSPRSTRATPATFLCPALRRLGDLPTGSRPTPTPAGLHVDGETSNGEAGGIRMEAMAYGPGNSNRVLYAIGNDPVPAANLPRPAGHASATRQQSPLHLDRERHGVRL